MNEETIKNSSDVNSSRYVNSSNYVNSSSCVNSSNYVYSSSCVNSSRDVNSSSFVNSSSGVYSSSCVNSSSFVIFCYDIKMKEYYAFNKQVSDKRYCEIRDYWNEIKDDFKLELKDNNWEDEWKKLPISVWQKLSKLPEFNQEVVEKIIGFKLKLNLNTQKEITIEEAKDKLKEAFGEEFNIKVK